MKQTPLTDGYNPTLLKHMRPNFKYVVEVGTGGGALADAYREINPHCHYVGIEMEPSYAQVASAFCSEMITANIEQFTDEQFEHVSHADCWVFSDVLEHLYDPWELLRKINRHAQLNTEIIACIPNSQHWSLQSSLCSGMFQYKDEGLLDRTHIRFFSRKTMFELFETTGYRIVEATPRILKPSESVGEAIKQMAIAIGADPEEAFHDAWPVQWVIRAKRN